LVICIGYEQNVHSYTIGTFFAGLVQLTKNLNITTTAVILTCHITLVKSRSNGMHQILMRRLSNLRVKLQQILIRYVMITVQGTDYSNIIYYTSYYLYNGDAYIQTKSSNKI